MRKSILALLVLCGFLTACGKTAKTTMEGFCSDLSSGKWQEAVTRFGSTEELSQAMAEMEKDPQSKQVLDALLGSSKCKVTAVKENTVTLEMDTVNGRVVLANVMADSIGLALASAFGGSDDKLMEEALMAKLVQGFTSPSAPRTKTTVDVTLEQRDGQWVPASGNDAQYPTVSRNAVREAENSVFSFPLAMDTPSGVP